MPGIFVSYRRDDSQGFAGRLADDLTEIFGAERVFRDIEIPVGNDFTDVLHRAIAASDLLLVVIGQRWAADSKHGLPSRLFEPGDWVRTEIEAAFAQGKQVIPVLVADASMPEASRLPSSIARLSRLQAAVLEDLHWDREVEELADRLRILCPVLTKDVKPAEVAAESPAAVLREIGERVLDEVASRGRSTTRPRHPTPSFTQQLFGWMGRGVKKALTAAVAIALLYVGIRLLGDQQMLNMLDAFEARLLVGWERLKIYLARI